MKSRRAGYTLIECLVVFSLLAFVLSAIAVSLHGLQRADVRIREEFVERGMIDQLAEQFRADAHAAITVEMNGEEEPGMTRRLRFALISPRSIEYSVVNRELVRTVREDGSVVHRESFPIRDLENVKIEIDRTGERALVTLWVPIPKRHTEPQRVYPFHAVVGWKKTTMASSTNAEAAP